MLTEKPLDVLVWAAVTRYRRTSDLTEIYYPQFWSLGSLRSGYQHGQLLVRVLFLVCRWLSSCCVLTGWRAGKEEARSLVSLIKALITFMRAPPSWPNYLPEAPPPNTIPLGARVSTYMFEGDTVRNAGEEGSWVLSVWVTCSMSTAWWP